MPIITVTMVSGRSQTQIRALIEALTDAAHAAMHFIALFQQQFRQICTVLSRDAGDERRLSHTKLPLRFHPQRHLALPRGHVGAEVSSGWVRPRPAKN